MRKSHWQTQKKGTFDATDAEQIDADLCARVQRGDRRAENEIVKRHMGLVIKVARGIPELGIIDRDDLIALAMAGVLETAKRFVPGSNRFSTYAVWWIRSATNREKVNHGKQIRIPGNKITETQKAFHAKHKTQEQKALLDEFEPLNPWSLDVTVSSGKYGDKSEITLKDTLKSDTPSPDANLYDRDQRETISRMIQELPEPSRTVIRRKFGIGTETTQTLAEIARDIGLSRERVRQIEAKALTILRMRAGKVADFTEFRQVELFCEK